MKRFFALLLLVSAAAWCSPGSHLPQLKVTGSTAATSSAYLTSSQAFVSRASSGSFTNASGLVQFVGNDVPRFDYDPTTHVLNGLLVEPAATNYVTNTSTVADWMFTNDANQATTVIYNSGTAPDGTSSAMLIVPGIWGNAPDVTSVGANRIFIQPPGAAGTGTYTVSIWIKTYTTNSDCGVFVVTANSDSIVSQNIVTSSSTWQRITVTGTTTIGGLRFVFATKYPVLVWGPQAESGSAMTSFISSGASAGTRAADYYGTLTLGPYQHRGSGHSYLPPN
jgi:hypothetical protein